MKLIVDPSYKQLETFVRQLPASFDTGGEVLYAGRNTVKRFVIDSLPVVVKRFKRPNLVQRIAYTFFEKSKAARAFIFAGMLRKRGIDTPHEIAYLELKQGGLLNEMYFVSTECNDPEIRDTLNSEQCPEELICALAEFLVQVHRQGVMHGDLNLTNILFRTNADGSYHFTLIDTNRSKFLHTPTQHDCLSNLRTLTHNRALLQRIITVYCGLQGWKADECLSEVLRQLHAMEQRRATKRKFQKMLGLR
jgi:tRNA A-37 threonylcarbamoyl transferase component Bud32